MKQRVTILHVTVISDPNSTVKDIIEEMMDEILDVFDSAKIQLITTTIETIESIED